MLYKEKEDYLYFLFFTNKFYFNMTEHSQQKASARLIRIFN